LLYCPIQNKQNVCWSAATYFAHYARACHDKLLARKKTLVQTSFGLLVYRSQQATTRPTIEESVRKATQTPFKLAASSRRPAQHDTIAPVSHSMQHVRAWVMIQCLFSPNGASPAAIAHGMPEKEVGGNKCQNEWQPALSRGAARAERLPGCCARLSCLVTGLLLLSFLSPHHRGASMAPSLLIFSVFPLFSLLLVFFSIFFLPF
jgi:hypothetical protein